jgi:hypothetical protein
MHDDHTPAHAMCSHANQPPDAHSRAAAQPPRHAHLHVKGEALQGEAEVGRQAAQAHLAVRVAHAPAALAAVLVVAHELLGGQRSHLRRGQARARGMRVLFSGSRRCTARRSTGGSSGRQRQRPGS